MAADGEKSSSLLLGRPMLMKYDSESRGWKLIVGNVEETIQRAAINISGSVAGEYSLVAALVNNRIKAMEVMVVSSSAANVRFQSGWSGTALTGPINLPNAGDGFLAASPDDPEVFHFQTKSGDVLVLDTDAGGQIGGWINYYYGQ